ncbi:DNA alkylation repair protein [bacterium (Candidatus Gribaldobacteria) CG10_big_fil_rev_8_21_14_0_10_37_21]|uniref:DNA alkylation repair protein n=1 Tax=bacterium (Candidatus Gribaldobacteria) CG10_big_fil_rev_8_21_14_0_10_37_21 TaxID=2014275 RepID=A0A2H0UU59_9BACT|nr:MAG: DNA alkylation repair protein [bacterium (Candidatus Gribaldobacteria) CG10_big_fil_rev_8_21_14_0_10_37_21]
MATSQETIKQLKKLANPKNVEGMERFGISPKNTLGVSMPEVRLIGKEIKRSFGRFGQPQDDKGLHKLALDLWGSGIHEARILASIVDLPEMVTEKQANEWVKGFDSWDVCDQVCMNLFDKTPFAFKIAKEWPERKEEFVKRAGFALMAALAVHDKIAKNLDFIPFLSIIKKHSTDERNLVKKAVNWVLRQIGKRNLALNKEALKMAKEIAKLDSKAAHWIAHDAIRELSSGAVLARLFS